MINKDLKEFELKLGKNFLKKTHDWLVWKTLILGGDVLNNCKMRNW